MSAWSRVLTVSAGGGPARWQVGGLAIEDGQRVGYQAPTRLGRLLLAYQGPEDWPPVQLTADVVGYDARIIEGVDLPCELVVELPCTVVVRPLEPLAADVQVSMVAAEVTAPSRGWGQRQTRQLSEGAPVPVPTWARSVAGPYAAGQLELGGPDGVFGAVVPADTVWPLPAWCRWVRGTSGYVTFLGGE